MNIHTLLRFVIKPFRQRRMKKFMQFIGAVPKTPILDVGGTIFNWTLIDYKGDVILLNLTAPPNPSTPENFKFVVGDGTNLEFRDEEFDVVFSNSVIEHVGSRENQFKFAREISRVSKKIWMQTPARSFFFEPHYLTPFVHFFPKKMQKKLLRNFSVWGWITRPSQEYVNDIVDSTTLLGHDDLREMFPRCRIMRERFLFMTKSYIVMK